MAGITAQIIAKITASKNSIISAKTRGTCGAIKYKPMTAPKAPIKHWPSAPMFQYFILKTGVNATATSNIIAVFHNKVMKIRGVENVPLYT